MNDQRSMRLRRSSGTVITMALMAGGALAALILAAGPLGDSRSIRVGFAVSLVVLSIGALLRQVTLRRSRSDRRTGHRIGRALESLESLELDLRDLVESFDQRLATAVNTIELGEWISARTEPAMQAFLEQRQSLRDSLGIGPFSEVMIAFSRMERSLHRCESALADRCPGEARRCLVLAADRTQDCLAALRKHLDKTPNPSKGTEA